MNLFHLQTFPPWLLAAVSFGCSSQTLGIHLQLLSVSKYPTPHPSANPIGSTYNTHLKSSTLPLLSSCSLLCPTLLQTPLTSLLLPVLLPVGFSQHSSHSDPYKRSWCITPLLKNLEWLHVTLMMRVKPWKFLHALPINLADILSS